MVKYKLFNSVQNSILSTAMIVSASFAASAVLALLKSRLLAAYFGNQPVLGVFYTADRIPSLIYTLVVAGTISSVFIPIFSTEIKKNREQAFRMASSLINLGVVFFGICGLIVLVAAPAIIELLSSGKFSAEEVRTGAQIMRILLLSQLILLTSSFVTGLLQSFRRFLIPALAPVLFNAGAIAGILFLVPKLGITGVAWGAVIGSLLHLFIQIPELYAAKFNYKFSFNLKDGAIKEMLKIAPLRVAALAVTQISMTIFNSLAILVSTSSVIYLKFADQLQSFPINLFGTSIAVAALPALSSEIASKDKETFKKTFLNSLFQIMYLTVPAGAILLVLRVPAVRLVYGASAFPWPATLSTAYMLGFFALAVFPQSASLLITRAFFALKDTKTPLISAVISLAVSVPVAYIAINKLGAGAWVLAFSLALSSIVDFFLLFFLLARKVGGFDYKSVLDSFSKISFSAVAMVGSLYIPLKLLDIKVLDTTKTLNLLILSATVTVAGMASYLFFTKIFKVAEIELFYKVLRKLNLKPALTKPAQVTHSPEDLL